MFSSQLKRVKVIYITGDTHGDFYDLKHRIKHTRMTEEDMLIICGDFGFIWRTEGTNLDQENERLDQLAALPPTIVFIDGNHENFDRLNKLPSKEKFGATVGVVRENIYHLRRGYVYTIAGKTFFTVGGGVSIDKAQRIPNISWWAEEIPSEEERSRGWKSLKEVGNKVDYILTHAAPLQAEKFIAGVMRHMGYYGSFKLDTLKVESDFNTQVFDKVEYQEWHFGHYHFDAKSKENNLYCHHYDVKELCSYES